MHDSRARRFLRLCFWFGVVVLVLFAIHSHRWSPSIEGRLVELAGAGDTVHLADVTRASWDRACLVTPYTDHVRVRAEASWEVPWGAGAALNEVDNVLLLVKDRDLVAYDRIDMAQFDFVRWPTLCIPAVQAMLVSGVDQYQRQVWRLVGQ